METIKAAAVSLYQLTIRSKTEEHCLPEYLHYLPLFLIDENDNPTPVITNEQGSTPMTVVFLTEPQEETFIVTNHSNVKTQHRCGGVRAYVEGKRFKHKQFLCVFSNAAFWAWIWEKLQKICSLPLIFEMVVTCWRRALWVSKKVMGLGKTCRILGGACTCCTIFTKTDRFSEMLYDFEKSWRLDLLEYRPLIWNSSWPYAKSLGGCGSISSGAFW